MKFCTFFVHNRPYYIQNRLAEELKSKLPWELIKKLNKGGLITNKFKAAA